MSPRSSSGTGQRTVRARSWCRPTPAATLPLPVGRPRSCRPCPSPPRPGRRGAPASCRAARAESLDHGPEARPTACQTLLMTSRGLQLSPRQLALLAEVQTKLGHRTGIGRVPVTDDDVALAVLESWIAGVLSSQGRVTARSVRDLLEQQIDSRPASDAERLIDSAVAAILPARESDRHWPEAQVAVVKDHCADHGYTWADLGHDELGYVRWSVTCTPGVAAAQLSTNGEVVQLSFPGGYSWAEFGYSADGSGAALASQLRLLDAYAKPARQEVLARRWLGRRKELHLADGTRLWRRGGSRPHPPRQ